MKNLSIIFFGNTKYSTIGARIIHSSYPISLIVTKKLTFNPIKQMADEWGIPTIETNQLDAVTIDQIKKTGPDFLIVEDFGLILPPELLKIPKYTPLNIHQSLLPKYRGPSPAPAAILNRDTVSGVSILRIINTVDAGPILAQQKYTLQPDETTHSLLTKLNQLGAELLIKVIKLFLDGSAKPKPQKEAQATYTKRLTKQDGYFDINNPPTPEVLDRMIRAFYPWPGVWTKWRGKRVKFLPSRHPERLAKDLSRMRNSNKLRDSSATPQNDKFLIQMEGKKVIPIRDFLNGYPDFPLILSNSS